MKKIIIVMIMAMAVTTACAVETKKTDGGQNQEVITSSDFTSNDACLSICNEDPDNFRADGGDSGTIDGNETDGFVGDAGENKIDSSIQDTAISDGEIEEDEEGEDNSYMLDANYTCSSSRGSLFKDGRCRCDENECNSDCIDEGEMGGSCSGHCGCY